MVDNPGVIILVGRWAPQQLMIVPKNKTHVYLFICKEGCSQKCGSMIAALNCQRNKCRASFSLVFFPLTAVPLSDFTEHRGNNRAEDDRNW